ncbi:MAG: peptidoglycan-binding protein [Candidatus Colwellbacteria bacterium]
MVILSKIWGTLTGKTAFADTEGTEPIQTPEPEPTPEPTPPSDPTPVDPPTGNEGATTTFELVNPLKAGDIGEVIAKVGEFLIYISTAVLTIFILYGAFQLMTSGGNPERVEKGRKTIFWAILGFVVLLIAGGVGALVADILGGSDVDGIAVGESPISNFEGVRAVLMTIARWMFGILMALGIIMVLYSAFLYLFSGGDDTRISTARKTLTYAIVALVIAVLAGGVGVLVQNIIGTSTNIEDRNNGSPSALAHPACPNDSHTNFETIRKGDSGAYVGYLKKDLNLISEPLFGRPGGLSGNTFDEATEDAVRAYQTLRRLSVDGVVGPLTWGQLATDVNRFCNIR